MVSAVVQPGTQGRLLERETQLRTLATAVEAARAGRSSALLVSGEAGIGKTTLIRAFVERTSARVLLGGCDDLRTSRTLGPLRDAALGSGGPLEQALAAGTGGDAVFDALATELSGTEPTVLVVEDIHWADDATIDVLRFLGRRLDRLRTVLVLTFRDDALDGGHPVRQLLSTVAPGSVARLALAPLSPAAVGTLAEHSEWPAAELYELTRGNPFYVTEAVAAPADVVPASVVDAVRSRLHRLDAEGVAVVEQLSVIPSAIDLSLADALVGDRWDRLTDAEEAGVLELRERSWGPAIVFRHEIARRAVESSLPQTRRRTLNRAVVDALLAAGREPDLAGLVHHAAEAGDGNTLLKYAPLAGAQASVAGSHRQALAHYEGALPYADRLAVAERAELVDAYAWELHIAHRNGEAVRAAGEAVELRGEVGEPVPLVETLVRQSRLLFVAGDTAGAMAAVARAIAVARPTGSVSALAVAESYRGAMLTLTMDAERAMPILEDARRLAGDAGRTDLTALCLNYLGIARCDLGDRSGLLCLRDSLAMATGNGDHESTARAYTNLVEVLYRYGDHDEMSAVLDDGLTFMAERGFWSHAYNLEVHTALLLTRRGDHVGAEDVLRALFEGVDDPGMLYVYSAPALGRLLARRGDPEAGPLLAAAWQRACRQRSMPGYAYAATAYAEWAWLQDRRDVATTIADVLRHRPLPPGATRLRAELGRYLARAGAGGRLPSDGCTDRTDGLEGDGDPYERAVALADSGEAELMLAALRGLDALGAAATASLVRHRLRLLGVQHIPRGARPSTRTNPAGLTTRQVEVLELLASGLTNAEIAQRLVVSVRTVDHHVSAVLAKLGTDSRRRAAAVARELGLLPDEDRPLPV